MMTASDIDETSRQFLIQLFAQTRGDVSAQVSMYDIGAVLGLERGAASKVAEELIGLQLIEIRTLSGGIAISSDGSEMAQRFISPGATDTSTAAKLGDDPILDPAARRAVEILGSDITQQVATLGYDPGVLAELAADLRTIDAQLVSSRPKTAIIRECFRSIRQVLKARKNNDLVARVQAFIQE
jgi:hypothetical protein